MKKIKTEITYGGHDLYNWRVEIDGNLYCRGTAGSITQANRAVAFQVDAAARVHEIAEKEREETRRPAK